MSPTASAGPRSIAAGGPITSPPGRREVDPTGAGDVFAAAYLIRYHETGDPYEAAQFANLVASFSVEAPGTEGIPTRDEVLTYLSLKRRRIAHPSPRRGFPR